MRRCLKTGWKKPGIIEADIAVDAGSFGRPHPKHRNPILRIARNLLLIVLAVLLLPYLLAPLYRAGHPVSALMAWRYLTGAPVSRQWIDLGAMSPALAAFGGRSPRTRKFCTHHGIDWGALREVIDDAEDGEVARGGSTITQQVAKNLFLWPGRSVVRKALELPLAIWIDFVLPKAPDSGNLPQHRRTRARRSVRRAEPAPSTPSAIGASTLSPREAALLAAILPNPHRRSARNPGPGRAPSGRDLRGPGASPELQRCWSENRGF